MKGKVQIGHAKDALRVAPVKFKHTPEPGWADLLLPGGLSWVRTARYNKIPKSLPRIST